jgi:hypothetical protein
MFRMKFAPVYVVLAALLLASFGRVDAQSDEEKQAALIAIVSAHPPFDAWLPQHEGWFGQASDDDGDGVYYIDFFTPEWEEWLGNAYIDARTLEVSAAYAPIPLTDDEYDAQLALITPYIVNDIEVLGWLNNLPDQWDVWTDFNRWDQRWEMNFYRGIVAVQVQVRIDDNDNVWIEDIIDPNLLDKQQMIDDNRDAAITLAHQSDGIWDALEGFDDWTTYVEWQHDAVWSVSFVTGETMRFFALVDLGTGTILESERG